MSLILVATVGGVLLERRSCARPERRVGVRRGRCGWTRPATGRGPPTAVFDRPLCQMKDPHLPTPCRLGAGPGWGPDRQFAPSVRNEEDGGPVRRLAPRLRGVGTG